MYCIGYVGVDVEPTTKVQPLLMHNLSYFCIKREEWHTTFVETKKADALYSRDLYT